MRWRLPWTTGDDNPNAVMIRNEVEKALAYLQTNATDVDGMRQRIAQAISGGYDYADTMHNVYLDYGYPQSLQFSNFWNMYRRFGIAKNIIELPVDTGWMTDPEIEAPEAFLKDLDTLVRDHHLWTRLSALDTRQRVGRYAGMFVRVRDNKTPDQPIEGGLNGPASVIALMPIYEGQLRVSETDSNPMSDNFGMPTMYEFNSGSTGNRNEQIATAISIHPSRIIIAAEGADQGGIYGISALEAPYNSLMDLRKIIGAGGEGFYRNAAQNLIHTLKDGASAKGNEDLLAKMNDNTDDFLMNRFRRSMWTPGMETKILESSLANPKEFFANALNDTAAASKIPATILIGQQTGRLASNEDSRHFLSGINSRREGFMTQLVSDALDWFITYGVLPAGEYEVEWDDLLALGQKEKLENANTMSQINERQFKAGQDVPFTAEEVREEAGYDPDDMDPNMIEGEDDDGIEPVEETEG